MKKRKFKRWFRFWRWEVQRRWNDDLNPWGDFSGYSGSDGGWEYRVVTANAALTGAEGVRVEGKVMQQEEK